MSSDIQYFRKRISEERALAQSSDLESLRDFHRLLAESYAQRLAESPSAEKEFEAPQGDESCRVIMGDALIS